MNAANSTGSASPHSELPGSTDHPSRLLPHTATLLKLADGFVSKGWNPRYFILRGSSLQYFTNARDQRPKEVIDLLDAEVSWLGDFMDQSNCIVVSPVSHRPLHVASNFQEEGRMWLRWLQEAADPQAYVDLGTVQDASFLTVESPAGPASGKPTFHRPAAKLAALEIPKDLPSKYAEVAHALEKTILTMESGSVPEGLVLLDVLGGIRCYAPVIRRRSSSMLVLAVVGFLLMGIALFMRDMTILVLVTVLALLYGYRTNREMYKGKARVSASRSSFSVHTAWLPGLAPSGGLNWLLDPGRMPLWIRYLESAFSNRISGGGDELVLVKTSGLEKRISRTWWENPADGSMCVVGVLSGGFEGWCFRPGDGGVHLYLVTKGDDSVGKKSSIFGFSELVASSGNHDGSGLGIVLEEDGWTRGTGGTLVRKIDFAQIPKFQGSVWTGTGRKLGVPSKFLGLASLDTLSPFFGIAHVFGSTPGGSDLCSKSVWLGVLNSLGVCAKKFSSSVEWTKPHPSSQLCWIGAGAQAQWEVVEASRPNSGLWVRALLSVSGKGWSVKRSEFKYEFFLDDQPTPSTVSVRIALSPFAISDEEGGCWSVSLPSLVVSSDGKIQSAKWTGIVRVAGKDDSVIGKFDSSGTVIGAILDASGRKSGNIHGHWLDRVFIDSELVWTYGSIRPENVFAAKPDQTTTIRSPTPLAPPIVRMSSTDEAAFSVIEQLRKDLPKMTSTKRFTDQYLFRFAKARHFKYDEVKKMVAAHLDWLEEHSVDSLLTSFEYTELPLVKAAFPHGYHGVDKFGRPVYISRLAKTNQDAMFQATNWERFIKFWIQSYEDLLWRKMPACEARGGRNPPTNFPPPSSLTGIQTLTILDVKGIGISQLSSKVREFISVTSKLASENYPEILGTMYIVNSPSMFHAIWSGIKSMIDQGTREKIHVVKASQTKDKLLEVIDADQLPFFLGGDCKCDPTKADDPDTDFGCLSSDKGPWRGS